MSTIDKLNFGQDSAESEIETLYKVFLSTPFYNNLRERDLKKWLVLGRKGSGKTAACLMFFRQLKFDHQVSLITPNSLSAAKSVILDNSSINSDEAAILKWKYTFLLEVSRYIIQAAEQQLGTNYLKWPEAIRKTRAFLIDQDTDLANQLDRTMKFVRSINKFAISVLKVEGSLEVNSSPEKKETLGDELDKIFLTVQEASKFVFQKPLYILVDQVDDLWDSTEVGQNLVIGLLRAAKASNDYLNLIKIIVFLRSDIFGYLRFHDADKYRSHTEVITWDSRNLKKLISLRIRQSTGFPGDVDSLWSSVFPQSIDNKDSFEYVVGFTLMRPRDLIQLCNICRSKAKYRGGNTITRQDIDEAIFQYSNWKLEDLTNEYTVQYPFLERLLAGLLYGYSSYRLSRTEFETLFKSHKTEFIEKYGSVYFEPVDTLLQILYTIGLIGVIHNDRILYESLGDKFILSYAVNLEIHSAFRKGLNVAEAEAETRTDITFDQRKQGIAVEQVNISGSIVGDVIVNQEIERVRILLLSANPQEVSRLVVDEELRSINEALRRSEFRQRFQFQTAWVNRLTDLQEAFLRYEPNVVHFSGLGSQVSQIVLEDSSGNLRSVHPEALRQLFYLFRSNIRCVVLSGCYSELQAQAIASSINYVIGTSQALSRLAAIQFVNAFYQALAYGRDIRTAFNLGMNQIQLEGLEEDNLPLLISSIDPSSLNYLLRP